MVRLFFCYDPSLHKFLHNKNNVSYLCAALHEKTQRKFWLYERTDIVNELVKQYNSFIN
jgi:hypothetical protein